MQALDQLSREAPVALVRDLQSRLDAQASASHAAAGDLDYVSGQALTVLDNSGIPAQRKLAGSDERLRRGAPLDQMLGAVLDASDGLIVSRGLDGTVLSWNRGAERVLGWRADEIVGRSYLLFVPDERRSEAERIARIATAGHRISRLETIRRHKRAATRRRVAAHARARSAGAQRRRQHPRVGRHEHRRHRTQGSGGCTRVARGGGRFVPGCDHQP